MFQIKLILLKDKDRRVPKQHKKHNTSCMRKLEMVLNFLKNRLRVNITKLITQIIQLLKLAFRVLTLRNRP